MAGKRRNAKASVDSETEAYGSKNLYPFAPWCLCVRKSGRLVFLYEEISRAKPQSH